MEDEELLSERITIRFTESEIARIRRAMKADGMRKESAFIRRVMILFLQNEGFLHSKVTAQKKPRKDSSASGDASSTGSTPSYRRVHPGEVALISEEPGSTPSEFLSVHSRK